MIDFFIHFFMIDFFIHFLVCNLLISGMIGILFCIKNLLKSHLTNRTQYNLWFLPLCLMVVPFLPIQFDHVFSMFSWFTDFIVSIILSIRQIHFIRPTQFLTG